MYYSSCDKSPLSQGYIKEGYVSGVRENGDQYTHDSIWTAMAFALMGENDRACELFALFNPNHHDMTPAGKVAHETAIARTLNAIAQDEVMQAAADVDGFDLIEAA